MQLKKSTIACALALAAPLMFTVSGAAQAQTSSGGLPCVAAPAFGAFDFADTLTVYLSGATAPSRNLSNQIKNMFTKSGSDAQCHTYHDNAGNPNQTTPANLGRLYFAHLGLMRSDADIPASLRGRKVLFIKRDEGGSVWGVNPVARAPRMRTLAVDSTNCNATIGGVWRCNIKGIDPGFPDADTNLNTGMVSDFGVSDVEPGMFKEPLNVEAGQNQLSNAEVSRMISTASTSLMMGISTSNAVPTTTAITRAQYGNMLMGNIRDWSQVDASLTGKNQVVVCRRVQGSGTQTSYNWYFNNFPCQQGVAGTVSPARMIADSESFIGGTGTIDDPFTFDASLGYTVVENSGSGDVRNCLSRANSGVDHTFVGDDKLNYKVVFPGGGYRAIGVLSLDSLASANPNNNGWYFRPLDGAGMYNVNNQTCASGAGTCTGIVPSKQNLLQGAYDFAVEVTFQRRNTTVNNPQGDNTAPPTGAKLDLINELVRRVSAPELTNNSNASLPSLFTPVFDGSGSITNNVARAMRGFPTANTCKPLQNLF